MRKASNKVRPESAIAGLRKSHEQRKKQTLKIVNLAIRTLKAAGESITLGRIVDATKNFTGTGRAISASTILRNTDCRELYEREAKPQKRRSHSSVRLFFNIGKDKPNEAEARRMRYLMRSTKIELVVKIILIERELEHQCFANSQLRDQILLAELGPLK